MVLKIGGNRLWVYCSVLELCTLVETVCGSIRACHLLTCPKVKDLRVYECIEGFRRIRNTCRGDKGVNKFVQMVCGFIAVSKVG